MRHQWKVVIVAALLCGLTLQVHAQTSSISTAGADCSTATNCAGWVLDRSVPLQGNGLQGLGIYLNVATSGTFVFEGSQDATSVSTGTWDTIADLSGNTSATTDGAHYFSNPGYTWIRVRATAINGTATVAAVAGYGVSGSDVAEGVASSGVPVPVGGIVAATPSTMTPLDDSDRFMIGGDKDRAQYVRTFGSLADIAVGNNSNTDGASTELIAAAGSGIKLYLYSITCSNSSTTGIYVELKSATTVRYRIPVPAAAASDVNGVTVRFDPPLPPNAANEAWNTDGSAAATTIYCSGIAVKSKI